jgi:alpha-L-arabinofuranosidase
MRRTVIYLACAFGLATAVHATEFHVAPNGNDSNPGSQRAPLRTIQRAADLAQPGDLITVHGGVYRERVNPPRGGESDTRRIVYQAASGEKVEIKGSEVVSNWVKVQDDVWKVTLPNSFFGGFNPYADLINGDWFNPKGRPHHTGAVYLNGDWLSEAATLDEVLKPSGGAALWFGQVDKESTAIWAQFRKVDPNAQQVEINVRRTVFYPDKPGRNYITVRGFIMRHAATPWAPPTAEQVGLLGTHWSKGWMIEKNVISHSRCSGITLGKYGDEWDNKSANSAEGYVKTIERALANGWNRETIGHHVVRNNTIHDCEQTGICGSLGAVFSRITNNHIYNIWARRLFTGAEMAGIKIHASIDMLIKNNRIHNAGRGMWMDWMAQGTRITGNLCYDNSTDDLFVEVDHGPFLVDNNLFLSGISLFDMSEGGAFAHNLLAGQIVSQPEPRRATPYHPPHSTTVAGLINIRGGDHRFFNNIMFGDGASSTEAGKAGGQSPEKAAGCGLWVYDSRELPLKTGGNVYYNEARPYSREADPRRVADSRPRVRVFEEGEHVFLLFNAGPEITQPGATLVTTALLGKALVSQCAYENADGSALAVDTDYFGQKRNSANPTAGPFETPGRGGLRLKVW